MPKLLGCFPVWLLVTPRSQSLEQSAVLTVLPLPLFNTLFSAVLSFMLLSCTPAGSPRHRTYFADSSASLFHRSRQPSISAEVISHHHKCLDSMGQSRLNDHISSVIISVLFSSSTCLSWVKWHVGHARIATVTQERSPQQTEC